MNWLVKEEPTHYGFDELVKDKKAVWSGVRNALAQKLLRAVKKGDRIFYYHTGDERAVVGTAKARSAACTAPADASGKDVAVDVAPVNRLPGPVALAEIKADPPFEAGSALISASVTGLGRRLTGATSTATYFPLEIK